jgi:enoyl-CoA hydratase
MTLVKVADRDGIAVVTIDRPPANAMDPALLTAGLAALDELRTMEPRAVVLTGTGAFFSGGADLRVVPTLDADVVGQMARDINALFAGWYLFPHPVVCAVNGHAVAGGLVLALCGDHRVVGRSGRFGLTEVKVGIPYPSMAMAIVQAELDPPDARRLVLRGELFDAEAALGLRLFDEQVDDDRVLARSLEVAEELAALPPRTFAVVKARLKGAIEGRRGQFGGSDAAAWAVEEAASAAATVLED